MFDKLQSRKKKIFPFFWWIRPYCTLNFKFYDVQTGKQIITRHMLPNISRSKGNQAIKSGRLIEYNMRNNFLENLYTKCGGETSPRPFSKQSKLSISLEQQSKVL